MYTNQEDEKPAKATNGNQMNPSKKKKKYTDIHQRWQEFPQGGAHYLYVK
jgi:hypothetical protein